MRAFFTRSSFPIGPDDASDKDRSTDRCGYNMFVSKLVEVMPMVLDCITWVSMTLFVLYQVLLCIHPMGVGEMVSGPIKGFRATHHAH